MRKAIVSIAAVAALIAGSLSGATAQDRRPRASLAPELIAAASAFESYARTAAEISPGFTDAGAVAEALRVAAGYEPHQLQEGMVAYAALAALQEVAFVDGVRRAAREEGVPAVAERMKTRPDLALMFPGAQGALDRAGAALAEQADPLLSGGARVKQAAYDVQRQAWSRGNVANPAARLSRIKQISGDRVRPREEDADHLVLAVTRDTAPQSVTAASPVLQRGLALAALAILERAGEADAAEAIALAKEPMSASCTRLAKLNLFQCLAVAGPNYEDVFCMGEHALLEPARCIAKASGARPIAARSPTISTVASIERR